MVGVKLWRFPVMFHLRLACCVLCIKFLKYVHEDLSSCRFLHEEKSSCTLFALGLLDESSSVNASARRNFFLQRAHLLHFLPK